AAAGTAMATPAAARVTRTQAIAAYRQTPGGTLCTKSSGEARSAVMASRRGTAVVMSDAVFCLIRESRERKSEVLSRESAAPHRKMVQSPYEFLSGTGEIAGAALNRPARPIFSKPLRWLPIADQPRRQLPQTFLTPMQESH